MRILILSFYFPPDLSAGSFRAGALVGELSRQLDADDDIRVLTSEPNRYSTYEVDSAEDERRDIVSATRFPVPEHSSAMVDQAWSYAAYASSVLRDIWREGREYDVVFATSSRLMTGALGAFVAKQVDAPLYLDLRDLFTVNVSELFSGKPQMGIVPFLRLLERWTVDSAARVSVVSPGFLDHLRKIRDDIEYRIFTNGIDDEFLGVDYRSADQANGMQKIILYAGNIGEGQGLEEVIPEAAERLAPEFEFWIVGDGGRRDRLEQRVAAQQEGNVQILDPVPRESLIDLYRRADVLFLHLNDYEAFHRVLPSKVFEYAATGKPLLAGVNGVSRDFICKHVSNAAVFDPCDTRGLIQALDRLRMETRSRGEFVERFRRSTITKDMAADVLDLGRSTVSDRLQSASNERAG